MLLFRCGVRFCVNTVLHTALGCCGLQRLLSLDYWIPDKAITTMFLHLCSLLISLLQGLPLFSFEVTETLTTRGPLVGTIIVLHICSVATVTISTVILETSHLQFVSFALSCQNHEALTLCGNELLFTLSLGPGAMDSPCFPHGRHCLSLTRSQYVYPWPLPGNL